MYCDNCHVHLCTACVRKHLLDKSKEHKIVFLKCEDLRLNVKNIYQKYTNILLTMRHSYLCTLCLLQGTLNQYCSSLDIAKGQDGIKCVAQKDLIEMEKSMNPKYQEIASYTIAHKAVMKKSSLERTTAIDEH